MFVVWYAAAIQLLHRDLTHRVEGKLEYRSDLSRLPPGLRSFTEDLMESSKAASGLLPVDLAPMDVKVLMEQVQGEYQSVLEEKGLTPVFNLPQDPVFILADGKRFWRKYAMEGTRVYGDLFKVQISFDIIE